MRDADDELTLPARRVSDAEAEQLLQMHYGMRARVVALTSERDQNFRVISDSGDRYVLKFTHPSEDRAVTQFHTNAYLHIARVDPELPIPHLVLTRAGEIELEYGLHDEPRRIVRLLSFLTGTPLHLAPRCALQREHIGRSLARVGRALRDYDHPAAGHRLLWDITQLPQLHPLVDAIVAAEQRDLAMRFFARYLQHAAPALANLRAQVIHNDFQPWNLLVNGAAHAHVSGIIDFGDMVRAPLIVDLAVACAYHVHDAPDAFEPVADIVDGFHAVTPLEAAEVDLLYDLIAARLVVTVAITAWRARLHPHNAQYILRNAPLAWRGLERLEDMSPAHARSLLRARIGME